MSILLFIGGAAFLCAGAIILVKAIEARFGLPHWMHQVRGTTDEVLGSTGKHTAERVKHSFHEMRVALSRTPHLVIHLAYVMRDKLRGRFAHYIDEVKGKKPISTKTSNSEFLHAVKDHKDESEGGKIE